MNVHAFSKIVSATIIAFACAAVPAFANHGGGGGGGSRGGGGGFHSSGGGGFRGGASSAPRMGAGYSRGAASAPASGSYGRSGGTPSRSYSSPSSEGQRASSFSSAPRAVADGQWHSFGEASATRGTTASGSEARASASTGGGWQVFGGNRSAGTAGGVRSFSGQGRDVWENAPAARNVVSSSHALSGIHSSVANSALGNSGIRSSASLSASSRLAAGSAFGNSLRSNTLAGFGVNSRFGYGFGGGFGRGCWGCGFGFGFGLGWWPGWGFGFGWPGLYWDPWWWGPGYGSFGYGYPGYGYYGNSAGYGYGDPNYDNNSNSAPPEDYPGMDSGEPPIDQSSPEAFNVANSPVPVLLYMKDGSVYSARDYWVSGGQIHYILLSGAEHETDMDQFDVQRTINVNAKSGVRFTLKPNPNFSQPATDKTASPLDHSGAGSPVSQPSGPSEAPPAKSPDPAAPRLNLTSAPQVRS